MFDNIYKGKKVFLTGHTGFKGSWLALWLTKLGAEVCGYSLKPNTEPSMFNELNIGEKITKSVFGNILDEEKDQRPGSKDYELLKDIPPGDNYLYYTEKRGYPNPKFKWKSRYWPFLLKLSPDRPSWTIQASFSNNQGPFHWRNRFLRITELKRLQTFPDNYELIGDEKEQWRQLGNAVPVLVAEIFAKKIKEDYFNG